MPAELLEGAVVQVLSLEPPARRVALLWDALLHRCPHIALDGGTAEAVAYHFEASHGGVQEALQDVRFALAMHFAAERLGGLCTVAGCPGKLRAAIQVRGGGGGEPRRP